MTAKRMKLASIPIEKLRLSTKAGWREYKRRMEWIRANYTGIWEQMTGKPVNKPNPLRNVPGYKQRRRWLHREEKKFLYG